MGACDWLVSNIVLGVTIHLTSLFFLYGLPDFLFFLVVCVCLGGGGEGVFSFSVLAIFCE